MSDDINIKVNLDSKGAIKETKKFESSAKKAASNIEDNFAKASSGIYSNFKKNLKSATDSVLNFNNALKIGATVFAAKKLADGFISIGKKAAEAASIQQEAVNEMEQALIRTGKYTKQTSTAIQEFASQLQNTSKYGDEFILQNTAMIQSLANLDQQGLKRAMQAAVNLSAALQIDLGTASNILGKALSGNISSLSRYGISLKSTGNAAKDVELVLSSLEKKFSGAAAGQINTYSGALAQLSNTYGDLWEKIGDVITRNPAFVGIMNALTKAFVTLGDVFDNNTQSAQDYVNKGLLYVFKGLRDLLPSISSLISALQIAGTAWDTFKVGLLAIKAAFSLLADEIVKTQYYYEQFMKWIRGSTEVTKEVEEAYRNMGKNVSSEIEELIKAANENSINWDKIISGTTDPAVSKIEAIIKTLADEIELAFEKGGKVLDETKITTEVSAAGGAGGESVISGQSILDRFAAEIARQDKGLKRSGETAGGIEEWLKSQPAIRDLIDPRRETFAGGFFEPKKEGAPKDIFEKIVGIEGKDKGPTKGLFEVDKKYTEKESEEFYKKLLEEQEKDATERRKNLADTLRSIAETISKGLQTSLLGPLNAVADNIGKGADGAGSALAQGAGEVSKGLLQMVGVSDQFAGAAGSFISSIISLASKKNIKKIIDSFIDALPTVIDAIITNLPVIFEGLVKALPMLIDGIARILPEIIMLLADNLDEIIIALAEGLPQIINALAEKADVIIIALVNAMPRVIQAFIQLLPRVIAAFLNLALGIVDGLTSGLSKKMGLSDFIGDIKNAGAKLNKMWLDLVKFFVNLPGKIIDGFARALEYILNLPKALISAFTGFIDSIKSKLSFGLSGKSGGGGIGGAISGGVKKLGKALGFATGGQVVGGVNGIDTVPAVLGKGELVIDRTTGPRLMDFIDSFQSNDNSNLKEISSLLKMILNEVRKEQVINTNVQLGTNTLANAILRLSKDNRRLA